MAKTAIDPFFGVSSNDVTAPTRKSQVVTPSDTVDLPYVTKQLIITIGTGGTAVAWLDPDALDSQPTVVALSPGTYVLSVQVRRILVTGTALGASGAVTALWW